MGRQVGKSECVETGKEKVQEPEITKGIGCKVKSKRCERRKRESGQEKNSEESGQHKDWIGRAEERLQVNKLAPGDEAVYSITEGRTGRDKVTVVDVGIEGLPLAEAASRWGASIVGVVTPNQRG